MGAVYEALRRSRFFEDTIVLFTSDHGDFLGSHGDIHQKWYTAYDEAIRVPLIISNPHLFRTPRAIETLTSHADVIPTILGLARLPQEPVRAALAVTYREAQPLVGRDLSGLVLGRVPPDAVNDPVFFMTDDDMSRGLDQDNFIGIAYQSVIQPNHIETVVTRLADGKIWKYSRYFDNPDFWSDPGVPGERGVQDVVLTPLKLVDPIADDQVIPYLRTRKQTPLPEEFDMYVVTDDPMELQNLAGDPAYAAQQQELAELLDEQRATKRLEPQEDAGAPPPIVLPKPLDPF
jgi:choline-sulfatase